MSKYRKMATTYTSRAHLRAALVASGVPFEETLPGTAELSLIGYHGDVRPETAAFVVRRAHIGTASNDLGWTWDNQDKVYREVVSNFDSSFQPCTDIRDTVRKEYAYSATVAAARAQGYQTRRVDAHDGTIQIKVTGRL